MSANVYRCNPITKAARDTATKRTQETPSPNDLAAGSKQLQTICSVPKPNHTQPIRIYPLRSHGSGAVPFSSANAAIAFPKRSYPVPHGVGFLFPGGLGGVRTRSLTLIP